MRKIIKELVLFMFFLKIMINFFNIEGRNKKTCYILEKMRGFYFYEIINPNFEENMNLKLLAGHLPTKKMLLIKIIHTQRN